jgi:hypothetical protein
MVRSREGHVLSGSQRAVAGLEANLASLQIIEVKRRDAKS